MKISWRYILLSLALALLMGLALINRAWTEAFLIDPIARILWLFYRTILTVDQKVYWILLALSVLIVGLRLIPGRQETPYRQAYRGSRRVVDRVAYWDGLLQSAADQPAGRDALRRELNTLSRSIDSANQRDEPEEISLPPLKAGPWQRLRAAWRQSRLFKWLYPPRSSRKTKFDKQVETILNGIENKLEINHDRSFHTPGDND